MIINYKIASNIFSEDIVHHIQLNTWPAQLGSTLFNSPSRLGVTWTRLEPSLDATVTRYFDSALQLFGSHIIGASSALRSLLASHIGLSQIFRRDWYLHCSPRHEHRAEIYSSIEPTRNENWPSTSGIGSKIPLRAKPTRIWHCSDPSWVDPDRN